MRHCQRERKYLRKSCIRVLERCAFLGLLVAGLFSERVVAAEPALQKGQISIPDASYDFGTVVEGTKVKHDFIIRNSGNAPLAIQRIIPSCGCTNVRSSIDSVLPGTEGTIHVELDTSGFSGDKTKLIRVLTNDPDNSSETLTLKGHIENTVEISPMRLNFNTISQGDDVRETKEVVVRLKPGSGHTLGALRTLSKNVDVKEISSTVSEKRFSVSILPSAPVGEFRDRVILYLEGHPVRTVNIPIFAVIQGEVVASPASVSFGLIEGDEIIERSVRVDATGAKAVVLNNAQSDNAAISVSVTEIERGKRYVLKVRLDPKLIKGSEQFKSLVTIVTDSEPVLLNVYGTFPPKV